MDASEKLDESFSLAKLHLIECDADDENAASSPEEGARSLTSLEAKFQQEYEDEDIFINSVKHIVNQNQVRAFTCISYHYLAHVIKTETQLHSPSMLNLYFLFAFHKLQFHNVLYYLHF